MKRVEQLRLLQALDQEWDEKGKRYQLVRAKLTDQSELMRLRDKSNQVQQGLAHTKAKLRDSELELATVQIKSREVSNSLYGGKVLNPKDLDMLQKESVGLKHRLQHLEDATLELMTQVENLEQQQQDAAQTLEQFEAETNAKHATLMQEYNTLRTRLQEVQAVREETRGALSRNDLALYTELRGKKNGLALAQMLEGTCQVCRVSVPSRKVSQVESGDEIVLCEGCGRILFLA